MSPIQIPIGGTMPNPTPKPATESVGATLQAEPAMSPRVPAPAAPASTDDRITLLEKQLGDLNRRLDDAGILREHPLPEPEGKASEPAKDVAPTA